MIRLSRKRLIVTAVVMFLLAGIGYVSWTLAGLPPMRFVLRYGLSPGCEPTGQTMTLEGVEFVEIGPGIFRMGSDHLAEGGDWLGKLCAPLGLPWGERPNPSNEMPVHWVEFRHGFWIARTEVTNAQYEQFDLTRTRSENSSGDDHPVAEVSWYDAKRYCAWLADKTGVSIRLPTEAEWECACRAGSSLEYSVGDETELAKCAWICGDTEDGPHEVATKLPNPWGLHDLHGNVWEWCEDTWHASYSGAPTDGTAWVEGGVELEPGHLGRIGRGGCWILPASFCRSAFRHWGHATDRADLLGFRVAIPPSTD